MVRNIAKAQRPCTFGAYIKKQRQQRGLTQKAVAKAIKIAPAYYNRVEKDKTAPPSTQTLDKLASVLNDGRDTMYFMAGKVPQDVVDILTERPSLWIELRNRFAHGEGEDE